MTRTVIVAGGTGGLGGAVTAELLEGGWRVVVPGRSEESLAALGTHEALAPIIADLSDPAGAADVVALATSDESAPLHALVNLVGGFASGKRVHETPVEDFERQLSVNLRPLYLMTQAAVPHLIANGGGAIVCTSSQTALKPFPGAAGYVTSKAGVIAFADALAVEYAADDIRVNTILPGTIDTPTNRQARPNADPSDWTPPSRIATAIRFLIDSDAITGAHIPV
jgi:NAD(P)-dependent dehydrogenase (short-subunit alcohol dehydrogenase family)